jgi:hypothetical protein
MNIFSEAKKVLDKDGKVNPLGPYGKQKLTGREVTTYFRRNPVKDATIKKAVEVALDLGGADTIARSEIKKFYGDKVLKSKEVQQALQYANESFTYNQSLNQISEENLVEKNLMPDIQKIIDTKGAKKVGGIMVDMFTASMINQIYNKVNDSNKKKMEKSNISTLVDIAQRMMQKMGDNLGEGAFSVKLNKPYKRGDEKMYMDIIKKYGGKNLKFSPPKGRDPELDITFDGGDVKKIKSNLPNKGKGSEWISEGANPAQQAAIAISKKEKGEKPKNEDAVAKAKLTLKHTQDMQKLKDKQAREKESMSESDMKNVDDAPKDKWKALGFSQHPHKGFEDERLPKDMRDFRKKAKTPSQMRVEDAYRAMWEEGEKYAPQLDEEVANITVDPKNRINSGQQQAYHGMEIAKQARRMGLKSAVMHKHIRIKGAKKAVNDFLRLVIGKSRYGDPTEKDMSTPQVDKMLTKGLK